MTWEQPSPVVEGLASARPATAAKHDAATAQERECTAYSLCRGGAQPRYALTMRNLRIPAIHAQMPVERVGDLVYRSVSGLDLSLDVYRPGNAGLSTPAVFFIHGDGPADMLADIKDWGQYTSWAAQVAAAGLAAVVFNHRSSEQGERREEAYDDVVHAFEYVRRQGPDLGLNPSRIAVWAASLGVSYGYRLTRERREHIAAFVGLYGPPHLDEPQPNHFGAAFPDELPPILLVRAGLDAAWINEAIDETATACLASGLDIELLNHATGEHAFDIRSDSAGSRRAVAATLNFLAWHLATPSPNTPDGRGSK